MPGSNDDSQRGSTTTAPRRRRGTIAAIAGIGLALAGAAYLTAPPVEENVDGDDLQHSKRHRRDLERIAGKSGVLVNDLDEWIASLWQGRRRAATILIVSAAGAGVYALATRATNGGPGSSRS